MKPKQCAAIIHNWFAHRGLLPRLSRQSLLDRWPGLVGKPAAHHTRAVGWRGSVLIVEVQHPVWAQELSLRRQQLMDQLNQEAGQKVVTDLLFRVGPMDRGDPGPPGQAGASGGAPTAAGAPAAPSWLSQVKPDQPWDEALVKWSRRALARVQPVPCAACGTPVEGGDDGRERLCPICREGRRPGGIIWRAAVILAREPWLTEGQLARRIPGLSQRIYSYVKESLMKEWKNKLDTALSRAHPPGTGKDSPAAPVLRDLALRYVMMDTACRPQELSEEKVARVLGPYFPMLFTKMGGAVGER